jgi:hypothetical protein
MPFDSLPTKGARAVLVIDRVLALLDGGENWGMCWRDGRFRCVDSAVRHVLRCDGIKGSNVRFYLRMAISLHTGGEKDDIVEFNDSWWPLGDYTTRNRYAKLIEPMLLTARQLASVDE